eukprot:gnl/Hemi2/12097_TR4126_c0_g2_i1.p1 gnl/Hemi2/12097_TR4126_c0_g2~~gnl/Hemi2/12097_TR4126_c0_g2_i1.p1  ORF type:complete len:689 (-),score=243.49 gnl/Hemi2/12097_TR4126_c0_g2_i1:367-2433(-)
MEQAQRRIAITSGHISASKASADDCLIQGCTVASAAEAKRKAKKTGKSKSPLDFSPDLLFAMVLPGHVEYRQKISNYLKDPFFQHNFDNLDLSTNDHRELSHKRVKRLCEARLVRIEDMRDDPLKYFAWAESLFSNDLSFSARTTIQYNMFGACILNLGTEYHHQQFLRGTEDFSLPGSFAMTELGHGSNVRQIETTAVFDPATDEFVINTPTETAQKYWIGGASHYSVLATVFAQLVVGGHEHGVHVIVVQLRDQATGKLMPGIRTKECGHKMGLNGIDNGRIWFDNVRVPRVNLLNRFCNLTKEGVYSSIIAKPGARFLANIGELLIARLICSMSSIATSRIGLTVAIRYSLNRPQFGPDDADELPIWNFKTHQKRLVPLLATCYGLVFWSNFCKSAYAEARKANTDMTALHTWVSGLKAMSSWHAIEALQICRECMGGQGYLSRNLVSILRCDSDIFATLDGDNTVLMQMVTRSLLSELRAHITRKQKSAKYTWILSYLGEEVGMKARVCNPVISHTTARAHLRSADYQKTLFRYREFRQLRDLASILKKSMESMDAFAAWNSVLPRVVKVGKAHVERVMLDHLITASESCEVSLGPVLTTLRSLYALSRVEADSGWFQMEHCLAPTKASAVIDEVNALTDEIAPVALQLVSGFGIAPHLLEPTVAGDWVAINEYSNNTYTQPSS